MNELLLTAVHAQPVVLVTSIVDVAPAAGAFRLVVDSTKLHSRPVLKVSTSENTPVTVPLVARARQYHNTFAPRSRFSVQLVVPDPCAMPSTVNVRTGSLGKVFTSDTSK